MTTNDQTSVDAAAFVRSVIQAPRVAAMMYTTIELGLPDLLANGSRSADDLATATGTHSRSLYRLLRALAAAGFVTHEAQGRFALTDRGAVLRSDAPGQLYAQARVQLSGSRWAAWGNLRKSVQSGRSAFRETFGMSSWDYQAQHQDFAAIFNAFMSRQTVFEGTAAVEAYDFSQLRTVVDVGGGHGQLLSAILRANVETRGILFDQPDVVAGAHAKLDQSDLRDRCTIVGGSFFEAVPAGGDAYILKRVLHDWGDESTQKILRTVRRAMTPSAVLLLIEIVLPEDRTLSLTEAMMDLTMMAIEEGMERTESEFRTLLDETGFHLERVVPTESTISVIEATCA